MHKLVITYQENKDSIEYFLKLVRLGKKEGLTPEQIIKLIQIADNIHRLREKFQQLQIEVIDIGMRKSVGKEELKDLHNEIETAQEKLTLVNKAFKVKYEELTETCSQAQRLQNYVKRFKDGQDYQELEAIAKNEVGQILLDNERLLQNALVSVVVALRNDPDRYLLIDRMQLTPYSISTIINYTSYLASRRPPSLQGNEEFIRERVLETAARILGNLQKGIVDNTISTAAGLENGSLYSATYQALPYYHQSQSHLPRYFNQNSIETNYLP